ncbi:Ecm21 protein [Saccharomycopsis crataegensis]|uniref:Ecm21 protein n=1 Tax=Saccharomycopsis crataegensis TaxID=43959 RepID=A0AAV5QSH5_9ASCO|nr:Ecm21 protein [Saccharomycopsis crataegensis]
MSFRLFSSRKKKSRTTETSFEASSPARDTPHHNNSTYLVESLTSNKQNVQQLQQVLNEKVGLNLGNPKAIYNLYCLDLFNNSNNNNDDDNDKSSKKKSGTSLSRSNSLRRFLSNDYQLTKSISASSNKSNNTISSQKSISHHLNPLRLLRTRSVSEKQKPNFESVEPKTLAIDNPISSETSAQVEVESQTSDERYQNQHNKHNERLYQTTSSQDSVVTEQIRISVVNANDKIFFPTAIPSERLSRGSRVNRSLNNNVAASLDEEARNYENRSRRSLSRDAETGTTGDSGDDDSNHGSDNSEDYSDANLHTFAVIVSIPRSLKKTLPDDEHSLYLDLEENDNSSVDSSRSFDSLSSTSIVSSDFCGRSTSVSHINSNSASSLAKSGFFTKTDIDLSQMNVALNLVCKIFWKELPYEIGEKPPKLQNETFLVGESKLSLNLLKDFNYFVPADDGIDKELFKKSLSLLSSTSVAVSEHVNDSDTLSNKRKKILVGSCETQPLQRVKLKTLDQVKEGSYFDRESFLGEYRESSNPENDNSEGFKYPAGDYVFIIPTVLDSSFPETIRAPHASLNYKLNLLLKRFYSTNNSGFHGSHDQSSIVAKRLSIGKSLKRITSNFTIDSRFNNNELSSKDVDNANDLEIHEISTSSATENMQNQESMDRVTVIKSHSGSTISRDQGKHSAIKRELINKSFRIPVIRTPPPLSSALNKPIYVRRIWNDCMSYELTFPTKFVRLNSEIPINIELLPLNKDISIKKIRINVLERVSYVSKDMAHEYEEGRRNSKDHNIKERVVALSELRTTQEGGYAIREDVLVLPEDKPYKSKEFFGNTDPEDEKKNNLLSLCFNDLKKLKEEASKKKKKNGKDDERNEEVLIDRPLRVQIPLFFKGIKSQNHQYHSGNHLTSEEISNVSAEMLRKKKPSTKNPKLPDDYICLGGTEQDLDMELVNSKTKVKYGDSGFMKVARHSPGSCDNSLIDYETIHLLIPELYPDSNHFNYITVSHRLQICFRISKKEPSLDPKNPSSTKTHRYEVIIDAPIVLVSELCDDDNTVLPRYLESAPLDSVVLNNSFANDSEMEAFRRLNKHFDEPQEHLPTFEEATSKFVSSIQQGSNIDNYVLENTKHYGSQDIPLDDNLNQEFHSRMFVSPPSPSRSPPIMSEIPLSRHGNVDGISRKSVGGIHEVLALDEAITSKRAGESASTSRIRNIVGQKLELNLPSYEDTIRYDNVAKEN